MSNGTSSGTSNGPTNEPSDSQATADAILAGMKSLVAFYDHMDLRLEIEGDEYRALAPLNDRTRSHVGTVHAAFQWAAAEVLGGVVVLHVFGAPDAVFLVVKRVEIDFVAGAKTDIVAVAEYSADDRAALKRKVEEEGEAELDLPLTVRDTEGKVVATARALYLIRPMRK